MQIEKKEGAQFGVTYRHRLASHLFRGREFCIGLEKQVHTRQMITQQTLNPSKVVGFHGAGIGVPNLLLTGTDLPETEVVAQAATFCLFEGLRWALEIRDRVQGLQKWFSLLLKGQEGREVKG